jgi:formylmethanofuran dehydrogenase subunit B
VNLLRKWYHTELHKLSMNVERMMSLMVTVDAHSAAVAAKHYVLQSPEDDARLSKALVMAIWGNPVEFPNEAHVADLEQASLLMIEEVV